MNTFAVATLARIYLRNSLPCCWSLLALHPFTSSLRFVSSTSSSFKMVTSADNQTKQQQEDDIRGPLKVKRLTPQAYLPTRGSAYAAGYDLYSAYDTEVPARGKSLVKTDISISFPHGLYARVAPRSGLAWKHSIDVGAGVIDFDYRGNLGVILFNHSDQVFTISRGDRIAQLILERIVTPDVIEVDELDSTERNANGFGSTGISTVQTTSSSNLPKE